MERVGRTNRFACLLQIVFCCVGIAIIIWGSLINSQLVAYRSFTLENYTIESCMMLSAGCLFTLSICLEVLYFCRSSFGQGLIFILQLSFYILLLSAGIQAIVHTCDITSSSDVLMMKALSSYGFENSTRVSKEIDYIQLNLHCCGVHNFSDWFTTTWGIDHKSLVPSSCCEQLQTNSSCKYYIEGCLHKVQDDIYGCDVTIASVTITVFVVMILSPLWSARCRNHPLEL